MNENPFASSNSIGSVEAKSNISDAKVISGQRQLIFSVPLYLVVLVTASSLPSVGLAVSLAMLVMACLGFYWIIVGSGGMKIMAVLAMLSLLVPGLGFYVILAINHKATKYLKAKGYSVGLLGAHR